MSDRIKLHLGCGRVIIPDAVNVDILPLDQVDVRHDLNVMPWPWEDGEVYEIIANHLVEHLACGMVAFMDECWRLLLPGGTVYIEVPDAADLDLAWCDPTHVRPYRTHSFVNYFTIPGIKHFHYTDRAWSILHCSTDGHVVRFHGMPVPPEHAR